MTTAEQRQHTRFPVQGIHGTLRAPMDVRVLNLSRTGLAFETREDLQVGSRTFLELRHQAEAASLEIRVRWAAPMVSSEGRRYLVGASFVDVYRDRADGLWAGIQPHRDRRAS